MLFHIYLLREIYITYLSHFIIIFVLNLCYKNGLFRYFFMGIVELHYIGTYLLFDAYTNNKNLILHLGGIKKWILIS